MNYTDFRCLYNYRGTTIAFRSAFHLQALIRQTIFEERKGRAKHLNKFEKWWSDGRLSSLASCLTLSLLHSHSTDKL